MRKVMTENNLATKIISELKRTIKSYKIVLSVLSVFIITSYIGFAIALIGFAIALTILGGQ